MSKSPINGWGTRSVVGHQHNLFKFELLNDGVEIQRLIRGGIGVSGGFVRFPPPEKIKGPDPARARDPGTMAIIKIHIVWAAMHQDHRGLLHRTLSRVEVR